MEKHEQIKTETIAVAESLKGLSREIGTAPNALDKGIEKAVEALKTRLEVLAGELRASESRGELTEEQSHDIRNDISTIAHVLSLIATPGSMTSEADLVSLLEKIGEPEKILEEVPIKPGSLPPEFVRMGVRLINFDGNARGGAFQQLLLPMLRPNGTGFGYVSFIGKPEKDSLFTEISLVQPSAAPNDPDGAIIRLKTSEGETATILFQGGKARYINTSPYGMTEEEYYDIARMDPFQKAFMDKKREAPINSDDTDADAERNHSTVELAGTHKLNFKKVPHVLDTPGRRLGVLDEKDFSLDVHLPPGIELHIIDDRFIVVRDTRGVGFSTTAQMSGKAKTEGRGELVIRLAHIHRGKPWFKAGLHENSNSFSNFDDFVALQMQSVYMVEASASGAKPLSYQGVTVATKGPDREGRYTISGGADSLRIDPQTKNISLGFGWPSDITSIRPTNDLSSIPADSSARDYVKTTKGAVLLEARTIRGDATYYVAIFGTFPDGTGYQIKTIHDFPVKYKGFALGKRSLYFIKKDELDRKNTSTVRLEGGKFIFSNVPVIEFLTPPPWPETRDAGKQNFELQMQLPKGIKLNIIDDKYLLVEDELGVGFDAPSRDYFGADIVDMVRGDQYTGKILIRLSSFNKAAGDEAVHYLNFSFEVNGDEGHFSDLTGFLRDRIGGISLKETAEKPTADIPFRGMTVQGKGPDRSGNYVIKSASGGSYLVISPATESIIFTELWDGSAREVPSAELPSEYGKAHEYLKSHTNAIVIREDERRSDGESKTNYTIITFGKYGREDGYVANRAQDF